MLSGCLLSNKEHKRMSCRRERTREPGRDSSWPWGPRGKQQRWLTSSISFPSTHRANANTFNWVNKETGSDWIWTKIEITRLVTSQDSQHRVQSHLLSLTSDTGSCQQGRGVLSLGWAQGSPHAPRNPRPIFLPTHCKSTVTSLSSWLPKTVRVRVIWGNCQPLHLTQGFKVSGCSKCQVSWLSVQLAQPEVSAFTAWTLIHLQETP